MALKNKQDLFGSFSDLISMEDDQIFLTTQKMGIPFGRPQHQMRWAAEACIKRNTDPKATFEKILSPVHGLIEGYKVSIPAAIQVLGTITLKRDRPIATAFSAALMKVNANDQTAIEAVPNRTQAAMVPEIKERNGSFYADSRNVAEVFGKRHADVLQDVQRLETGCGNLHNLYFQEVSEFNEAANRSTRHFLMTKDGFTLLAMGYTGQKAMQFKIAYIERFNEMEETLRGRSHSTDIQALISRQDKMIEAVDRLLISHGAMEARAIEAEKRVNIVTDDLNKAEPKVKVFDTFFARTCEVSFTKAAKALQMRRTDLISRLVETRMIYREKSSGVPLPMAPYATTKDKRRHFVVLSDVHGGKNRYQTLITEIGMRALMKKLAS